RIPIIGGGSKPFTLHRGNLATGFCFLNNINQYSETSRMCYSSLSLDTLILWNTKFHSPGKVSTTLFNMDEEDCKMDISKMLHLNLLLPEYFQNNKYDDIERRVRVGKTPKNATFADHIGRSTTTPIIWLSNFAFINENKTLVGSFIPAHTYEAAHAKAVDEFASIIITSTPGRPEIASSRFAYDYLTNTLMFDEKFYDMDIDVLRKNIKVNSLNNTVHIKFTFDELGKDQKWLDEQKCNLCNNEDTINREIYLKWDESFIETV
ncbi:hypothetical protein V6O07_12945, partial [Arthrospira platensis SPKY2]